MAWYFFCKYVWTHISNSRIWLSEVSQNHVLISEIIPWTWSDIVTKLSSYIWRKRKGYSLEANQSESCGEAVPFIFKHEAGGGKAQTRRCLRNKCVLRGLSIRKDSCEGSDQDHPQEKEMQKGKIVVWGGLTNSQEKKRSKRKKRKRKDISIWMQSSKE